MSVGAFGRVAQHRRHTDVGSVVRSADQRRPRPGIRPLVRPAPQPEFQDKLATRALPDLGSFGGNQDLVVEVVEQRRLQNLGDRQRATHDCDRHLRVYHPAFGDGLQADALKRPVASQPGQEVRAEQRPAGHAGLPTQEISILCAEAGLDHPVQQPLQTGIDAVARHVQAVIRIAAKKVVKLGQLLMQSHAVVHVGHRELVHIGEQNTFSHLALIRLHTPSLCQGACARLSVSGSSSRVYVAGRDCQLRPALSPEPAPPPNRNMRQVKRRPG